MKHVGAKSFLVYQLMSGVGSNATRLDRFAITRRLCSDIVQVMEVHGIGTKGDFSQEAWVTDYTVSISEDGVTYKTLVNTHTNTPRVSLITSFHSVDATMLSTD